MRAVHATAPGKLFLLGEYAVLDGAPALLTAVDRRVRVTVAGSDSGRWRVSTPGLGTAPVELDATGSPPDDLDDEDRARLRVFAAVRDAVLAAASRVPAALDVTIDSTELFSADVGGHKLGLGSSAAVAVALTAALSRASGLPVGRSAVLKLALSAHRSAQGGTGSGGDVAASAHGGLIQYSRGSASLPLVWPEELTIMAVVTGTGSRTTDLVGRVEEYAARDETSYRTDIGRLAGLARQARDALRSPHDFLRLASDYFDALVELDVHARAGIVSERHLRLHSLAAGLGGVFKTSGAGGGDLGLVFGPSGAPAETLAAAFAEAGAEVVRLGFGADGFTITDDADDGAKDGPTT